MNFWCGGFNKISVGSVESSEMRLHISEPRLKRRSRRRMLRVVGSRAWFCIRDVGGGGGGVGGLVPQLGFFIPPHPAPSKS
jgi:hypothetical protein